MELNIERKEKKKSPLKLLLLIVGGAVLIMIMVNSMQEAYQLQHAPDAKAKVSAEAIPVSAVSLQNEYALNEDSAAKKYKDKLVLVNGKITEIDKYHTGESYIIFEKSNEASNIKLEGTFKKETAIDSLSKGQEVSVQGTLSFVKDVILIENAQIKK
jgi:tRNA_anti-like